MDVLRPAGVVRAGLGERGISVGLVPQGCSHRLAELIFSAIKQNDCMLLNVFCFALGKQ